MLLTSTSLYAKVERKINYNLLFIDKVLSVIIFISFQEAQRNINMFQR